jgi:Flp pilus assembly pilin Flp
MRDQRGQTLVEYILLLTVAISLVLTFFNSQLFKKYFGTGGEIGQMVKEENEFGYRHGYLKGRPPGGEPLSYNGFDHPSYYNSQAGETRFFGPKENYP